MSFEKLSDLAGLSMPRQTTSGTSKAALIARQIRMLLSAYRRDDYADPDAFVAQLGTVLQDYSEAVITHVTSPQTGLQRTCKFPPSIAEIVEACEQEETRQHRMRHYAEMPKPDLGRTALPRPPLLPGRRANLNVPRDHPRYHELYARATDPAADPAEFKFTPGGIKVALSWWGGR